MGGRLSGRRVKKNGARRCAADKYPPRHLLSNYRAPFFSSRGEIFFKTVKKRLGACLRCSPGAVGAATSLRA